MNIYDIWFARVEIANNIKLRLLKNFESNEIWNFSKNELIELNLKQSTIEKILDIEYRKKLEKYQMYMEKNKIFLFSYKNEYYPTKLKYISDKPAYIFIRRECRYFV